MVKTEAITLVKEDVLGLGQLVGRTVSETTRLLEKDAQANLTFVEEQEELINRSCQEIEERCLALLIEREALAPQDVRTLLGATVIAAKFERIADHAVRVAKMAYWAAEDKIEIPPELPEMAGVVQHMVQDALLCFLSDAVDKVQGIVQRDNRVDYLHDSLCKRLLSDLGGQDQAQAQMRAQFLFCSRFLERMGDACTSIAKRVYFIVTAERLKVDP